MADTEINIKLGGLQQIKKELRELKGELASATDPQQMEQLAQKAGLLSDQLKDANEQVAVFASGSPFEQTNNALGLMGGQLMSLDFEGAANSAKLFASAAKGINGEQIATQLKGLGGVVGNLGKGFMSLGKVILTNPIFLIAAVVAAIVAILVALAAKLGILKPIMKAVGEVFKAIGKAIDLVVQSIKDFLDWLGLTSFAAEEAAARQQAAFEKVAEARDKELKGTVKTYDRKIELAKIEGNTTVQMEREKQQAIIETEKARYRDLMGAIDAAKRKGDIDVEEIKKLREQAKAARENADTARFDLQKINLQEEVDKKKSLDEKQKLQNEAYIKARDKRKEEAEKAKAEEKKFFDETNAMLEAFYIEQDKIKKDAQDKIVTDIAAANDWIAQSLEESNQLEADKDAKKIEADDKKVADDLKRAQEKAAALQSIEQSLFSGLSSLGTIFINDQKKLEKFNKASALVQIGIDTAMAISALVKASNQNALNGVTGGFAGVAQFASGIAGILANIAKAKQLLTSPGASVSAGGGGGGGASTQSTQPITPQVNLFGQNNNANNLSGAKSMENTMIVKAYVSETDMTDTQKKIGKIKEAASL